MRIFLAEPNPRYDLKILEAHGPIKYVSINTINPFNIESCLTIMQQGLKTFDPATDYICMTGNLQTVAFMVMIAYSLFDTFRVLVFDARTSNYKERVIFHV